MLPEDEIFGGKTHDDDWAIVCINTDTTDIVFGRSGFSEDVAWVEDSIVCDFEGMSASVKVILCLRSSIDLFRSYHCETT